MYDYLGALVGDSAEQEWQALRNDCKRLNDIAKSFNVAIMTALQATFELLDVHDLRDTIRNTRYVSFSKNIINNVSQAAYLIKKGDSAPIMTMLKSRYTETKIETPVIYLNYGTEEFEKTVEVNLWRKM